MMPPRTDDFYIVVFSKPTSFATQSLFLKFGNSSNGAYLGSLNIKNVIMAWKLTFNKFYLNNEVNSLLL